MTSKHPIAHVPIHATPAPAEEMAMGGYTPPPEEEPSVDIRRYIAAVMRYKWLLVVLTLAGGIAGGFVSRMQKPEYEAQATIWVESPSGSRGPIEQGQLLQNTNWVDLLRSYTVLDSVIRQQRLFLTPENLADTAILATLNLKERFRPGSYELKVDETGRRFTLTLVDAGAVQSGTIGDSIGAAAGIAWLPMLSEMTPGRTVKFTVTTPRQAALMVNGNLDARIPARDGNFIRMTLKGPAPAMTAATLNSIAEQFVRVAAELKSEKLKQYRQILEEQLTTAHSDLRRSELDLESFRVSTITEPSDVGAPVASGLASTQAPALQNFFRMRTEADALKQDREAIERVLRQPPDSMRPVTLEAIPSVIASTELRAMLTDLTGKMVTLRTQLARYTPSYQPAVELGREITTLQQQTIPTMLRALLAELITREQDYATRIAVASRDLREIPTRSINETRLTRQMVIAQNLYTTLQQRYSEARLAELSSVPDVRILDAAVIPDRPKKNPTPIFLLGGLAGGVALAIGIALLLDHFDRRVRYPDQVTRDLGLAILGAVPRVRANGAGLRDDGNQQVVEALRSIRLNLVYAYGAAGPLITAITSPGSGDGKSFVASNLALAFADAGHKTLLIDADIRRGALHRALDAKRKPGLLDCLSGQVPREDIVQVTSVPQLDFIGCGTRKIGGPELLASAAMSQLLLSLRPQYGVIILDTAPLGAGVDPLVLGTLTGSLLLVMRNGVTDKELTQAKLEDLDRLPIRILGAILNDVKPQGIYKYYSYLPGYGAEDEAEQEQASAVKE